MIIQNGGDKSSFFQVEGELKTVIILLSGSLDRDNSRLKKQFLLTCVDFLKLLHISYMCACVLQHARACGDISNYKFSFQFQAPLIWASLPSCINML